MAVAARVGEALQEQQTRTLGPARAVGSLREGLAAAVRGQAALPAELDERTGRRHDRHAAGQRQRALALPQRLRGQVQRDQRRRAGRVDGDGGALQAERVGQPSRHHAGRRARQTVALDAVRRELQQRRVVLAAGPGEHTDALTRQRQRVDARPLERLPRRLQEQPLLRVHRQRLAGADAEQGRVELRGPVEESARLHIGRARGVGVGVVEPRGVPAAVVREGRHRVAVLGDEPPQVLGARDPAGEAATRRDDRDGLLLLGLHLAQTLPGLMEVGRHPLEVLEELFFSHHYR
ncbi:hypothetical protein EES42_39115 [Streptomyces sp. ADI95-17]|nr:hypothetical protein EES42_39115 [Streptomyces sp. ADI95-17]